MHRPKLSRVRLVTEGDVSIARLASELPTVSVEITNMPGACDPIVDADAWTTTTNIGAIDSEVARRAAETVSVRGDAGSLEQTAIEVLTRCQRFLDRRNAASATSLFDAVLRAHEGLHDVSKPLVKADLDHAVDAWQWMLRLDPDASLAAQLAALFHDIERLESEADKRVEQHAPDYAKFKNAHARRGGDIAYDVLVKAGVDDATASRVRQLVAVHEVRGTDAEVDLLNDADALSFFSLNSPGYADYFGPEQTRKKVRYTLARLGPRARERLSCVRLRPDVDQHLATCVKELA